MKKAILLFFMLLFIEHTSVAQQITFKSYYKPDKTYTTKSTTAADGEIQFKGDKEVIKQIEASGMRLPIVFKSSTIFHATMVTGASNNDQTFPARLVYDTAYVVSTMNGAETRKSQPLSGLIMEGTYMPDYTFRIDTMISTKVDQRMKESLKTVIESIQQQIKFPDKPLKKGDKFEQRVPMQIPIAGMTPVKLTVTLKYKLREITTDQAFFDLVQDVELDMSMDKGSITATGEGKGNAVFDITNNIITTYNSDLAMDMSVSVSGLKATAKMKTSVNQVVTVQ